jgi:hypothetical protein
MTEQYRATPEQWAWVRDAAHPPVASCFFELLARVEALERQISELQTLHNTAVDWRMEQDARLAALEAAKTSARPAVKDPLTAPPAHTIAECGGPCEQDFRLCDCGLLQQLNPKP